MMDMINDGHSKLSLLIALTTYKIAFFSEELYDSHYNFRAKLSVNIEGCNVDFTKSSPVYFFNGDFSTLGVLAHYEYVYINTLYLTYSIYRHNLTPNKKQIDARFQTQIRLLEKLSNLALKPLDSKDVDGFMKDIRTGKNFEESLKKHFSHINDKQVSIIDSLIINNKKFKTFDPFVYYDNKSLMKIRQTAEKDCISFYELYDIFSNNNNYQYSIYRNNLIEVLRLLSFCGSRETKANVEKLEKKDLLFLQAYKDMKDIVIENDSLRSIAKKVENDYFLMMKNALLNGQAFIRKSR